jgi:hypothetical protein
MKSGTRISAVFLALGLVAAPGGSGQQFPVRAPSYISVWNLKVGSAAIYDLEGPHGQKAVLELAVVGKESINGKEGYWVEISSRAEANAEGLVVKALFYRDVRPARRPHNPFSWLLSETAARDDIVFPHIFFETPGHSPVSVDGWWTFSVVEILSGYRAVPGAPDAICDFGPCNLGPSEPPRIPKTKLVGKEDVATPARTFSCDHLKFDGGAGDIWVTPDAPPFGLVKAIARDSMSMALSQVLTDAKSNIVIIGTPQQLDLRQFRQLDLKGDLWDWIEHPPHP